MSDSGWQLDPESPFYDEFSEIKPGQWWITTPNGLIGCSSEDDAKTILDLFEQYENLIALRDDLTLKAYERGQENARLKEQLETSEREWKAENEALALDLNAEHVKLHELKEQLEIARSLAADEAQLVNEEHERAERLKEQLEAYREVLEEIDRYAMRSQGGSVVGAGRLARAALARVPRSLAADEAQLVNEEHERALREQAGEVMEIREQTIARLQEQLRSQTEDFEVERNAYAATINSQQGEIHGLLEQLEAAQRLASDNAREFARLLDEEGSRTQGLQEQFEVSDAFARVADAYCWDPETTTHDDLMNARAEWQTAVGQMKLRAASSPASTPKEDA